MYVEAQSGDEDDTGYSQIGYHGAGGGDITVLATDEIGLEASAADSSSYAMIGNGSLNGDITGATTGNIFVSASNSIFFETLGCDCDEDPAPAAIGNFSGAPGVSTGSGDVVMLGSELDDDGLDSDSGIRFSILNDIQGGDVTVGFTSSDIQIGDPLDYSSAHDLTLLTAGDLNIGADLQNAGTGAITLVAGWDRQFTPGHFGDQYHFGNGGGGGGTVNIGGEDASGNVAVGTASGALNVYAGSVSVNAGPGDVPEYSQLGYHGAGGGDITVVATQNINVFGSSDSAEATIQIGNGSLENDISGNVTGNINLTSGGQTAIFSQTGEAWLGNHAADGFTESGDVTSVSTSGSYDSDFMEADLGTSASTGGDLFIGFRDTSPGYHIGGDGIEYSSPHDLTFAVAGGLDVDGNVINNGTGALTIVAGWDGVTVGTAAQLQAAGAYGLNGAVMNVGGDHSYTIPDGDNPYTFSNDQTGDISVGTAGGTTTLLSGDVTIAPSDGFNVQVGYRGAVSGNIDIESLGTVTLNADSAGNYAQIGNGGSLLSGTVGGNITINAGAVEVTTTADNSVAQIGNGGLAWNGNVGGDIDITTIDDSISLFGAGNNSDTLIGNGGNSMTGAASGDITLVSAGDIDAVSQTDLAIVMIGNGGVNMTGSASGTLDMTAVDYLDLGTGAANGGAFLGNGGPGSNANPTAGFSDTGDITINAGDVLLLAQGDNSPVAIGNGGFGAGSGSGTVTGSVAFGGDITINANSVTLETQNAGSSVWIGNGGDGAGAGLNITGSLTYGGDITFNLGSVSTAGALELDVEGAGGSIAHVGNGGFDAALNATATGGIAETGTIDVNVLGGGGNGGSVEVESTGTSPGTAYIGNGGLSQIAGTIGGNVTINADGTVEFESTSGNAAFAGNAATTPGAVSGDLTIIASEALIGVGQSLNEVAAGNVLLELTDPSSTLFVSGNAPINANGAHNLTILAAGSVYFTDSFQNAGTGAITIVAGWDGTTTNPANFATAGVYGNNNGIVAIGTGATGNVAVGTAGGNTTILAAGLSLIAQGGYAQLGYHGDGTGAIDVDVPGNLILAAQGFNAIIGNGTAGSDVTGNVGGNINLTSGGASFLTTPSAGGADWIGNRTASGTETGNLVFLTGDVVNEQACSLSCFAAADLVGGDVTIGFTSGVNESNDDQAVSYNSSHTLNILTVGSFGVVNSIQNSGTGAINIVAGWDGHTLDPSQFGNAGVYGNDDGAVLIGGSSATGNAAIGSAGGTTSVYADGLFLDAANGYAQLGVNGHGSGAISVKTLDQVALQGGSGANYYAQIGNGGRGASGDNHGDIDIVAGGNLSIDGGAGSEAYAQIGHGGAESNANSTGYSNVAPITITAENFSMSGGAGSAAYAMIGNGGYKAGEGLIGTGVNSGDITITSSSQVGLGGGSGSDAFVQIGNGGSQSNLNPSATAGGSDTGTIVVTAPNGTAGGVFLFAGAGANSYAQIGNGGYAINSGTPVSAVNFTASGNVTVTDLDLRGGDTNPNSYAQIGNGDASQNSVGNVGGTITTNTGGIPISLTDGTAPDSPAVIGNFTGQGTGGGSTGPGSGSPIDDPGTHGAITTSLQGPDNPTIITTIVITDQSEDNGGATGVVPHDNGPIAELTGDNGETPTSADDATVVIADSLDGAHKPSSSQPLLGNMLKQFGQGHDLHGVPPADQDVSSWGNEALWQ